MFDGVNLTHLKLIAISFYNQFILGYSSIIEIKESVMKVGNADYEVKIIQIIKTENDDDDCHGSILGLGDDGVIYCSDNCQNGSGWVVYIEDNFKG